MVIFFHGCCGRAKTDSTVNPSNWSLNITVQSSDFAVPWEIDLGQYDIVKMLLVIRPKLTEL